MTLQRLVEQVNNHPLMIKKRMEPELKRKEYAQVVSSQNWQKDLDVRVSWTTASLQLNKILGTKMILN